MEWPSLFKESTCKIYYKFINYGILCYYFLILFVLFLFF